MFLENFKDIDEFIDAFYGTFNSKNEEEDQRSLEEIQRYTIPKQISTNNKEINVVGIDLGTTRCCAAVNRKNGIQTVALENTGERLLPSYVAFDEKHIKCGQIVVYRLRNYSEASVFDIKRIIGRRFENLKVDESWTFEVCNDDGKIFIKTEGFNGDILKMTPEDISAELLKYIKHKTEEFQGQKLFEAVITVPAAFDEAQRKATIEAANLAGWETVQLLPEPVAAAFAYFIDRPIPENSTLLLFDLGGGTLDVCIFKISNGELNIISRSGDPNLGGRDFDSILINYFKEKLKNNYEIILSKSKQFKLMQICQEAKETLTVTNEYL
uniref:Heat shock protein 70 n=1 Tax=Panagrolaimus superbus TaxID=310955 RepID=A0A914ZBE9_9BILA